MSPIGSLGLQLVAWFGTAVEPFRGSEASWEEMSHEGQALGLHCPAPLLRFTLCFLSADVTTQPSAPVCLLLHLSRQNGLPSSGSVSQNRPCLHMIALVGLYYPSNRKVTKSVI